MRDNIAHLRSVFSSKLTESDDSDLRPVSSWDNSHYYSLDFFISLLWSDKRNWQKSNLSKFNSWSERKEQRMENSDISYLGRTVMADILNWIFLTSEMAANVCKSKKVESSLNSNNLFSNKYPIKMFDLTKWLSATVFTYFF